MPADSPQTIGTTTPEPGSSSSRLVRTAGSACATILALHFAIQTYWIAGGGGMHVRPMLGPLVTIGLAAALTLGAAALLLTRIGVLALPVPRWLLRVAPWGLTACFALLALTHFLAFAENASGDWRIDLQGPLLLALAGLCIIVASEPPAAPPDRRALRPSWKRRSLNLTAADATLSECAHKPRSSPPNSSR